MQETSRSAQERAEKSWMLLLCSPDLLQDLLLFFFRADDVSGLKSCTDSHHHAVAMTPE